MLPLLALSFVGCAEDEVLLRMFDGPIDVAVLEPNQILDVHTGFVTNFRSGKIVKLDLKHETYLGDNPLGSWIRSTPLATGRDRLLEQVAVAYEYIDETNYRVTVFASDSSRGQLLVVPYLETAAPRGAHCTPDNVSIPRYGVCLYAEEGGAPLTLGDGGQLPVVGADGTALSGYSVSSFRLREGRTTTEGWKAVYRDGVFQVLGSRSGLQEKTAVPGEIYFADRNEIEFLITAEEGAGELPEGATFSFYTDSGIREIPVDGTIEDLRIAPEHNRLYATVQSEETLEVDGEDVEINRGHLAILELFPDASSAGELPVLAETLPLCPVVYQLNNIDLEPALQSYTVLPGLGPNTDVAFVEQLDREPIYQNLFVANLDGGRVSSFDLMKNRVRDHNPLTPEIDAIELESPIRGLAAGRVPVFINEYTDELERKTSILVAATTYKGDVYSIKGEDGCLPFSTVAGPSVYSVTKAVDSGSESNPSIDTTQVGLSPCGGITKSEVWYFIYDEQIQAYRVRGSITNGSNEFQNSIAYEDERYVSDGGEISLVIRAGTLPTSDGDTIAITVVGNVTPFALGGINTAGYVGALPSDLEMYDETYGDRNQPWTPVQFRTVAVVPAAGSDEVFKIDIRQPGNGGQMVIWQ